MHRVMERRNGITEESLRDDSQMLLLYSGAISRGWISTGQADRMNYFGAAEHALNSSDLPGRLFAWIVMTGAWGKITDHDERNARLRVRKLFDGIQPTEQRRRNQYEELDDLQKASEQKLLKWRVQRQGR